MENIGKVTIAGIIFLILVLITTWAHVMHLDVTCTDYGTFKLCQDAHGDPVDAP